MLTVEKIESVAGLRDLREEWERLLAHCPHRTPFLTHAWMMTWWKYFGRGKELFILVVREQGRVVAIAPLMRYRGRLYDHYAKLPARIIESMANYHSNRVDVIYREYRDEVVRQIWQRVLAEGGWDFLRLYPLAADSPTVGGLRRLAATEGLRALFVKDQTSPYVSLPQDWDQYTRQLSAEIRRKARKASRLIASNDLSVELVLQTADIDGVMQEMFEVAEKGWAGAQGTAISSTEQLRGFYTELAHEAQRQGWLFFTLLRLGERPIAFEYNLRYDQTIYNMVIGFDPAFSRLSPGHVVKYYALREAFGNGRGIRTYDFLGDAAPYKLMWTQQVRPHVKIYLYHPHSAYARLLHLIQSNLVQPIKDRWWHRRRM